MADTIQRFVIPPFTLVQKFLVKLLSEYYEKKAEDDQNKIENLNIINETLHEEINSLKAQVRLLELENIALKKKSKAANNMVRILTKTKEDGKTCKTPVKIVLCNVERLLRTKFNETTAYSNSDKKNNHTLPSSKIIVKSLPAKVPYKKDIQVLPPKLKETRPSNVKDLCKQKEARNLTVKKPQSNISQKISPKKPIIQISRGKENRKIENGPPRIAPKLKTTNKTEQKILPGGGQSKGHPKNSTLILHKNVMNRTFVIP